MIVIVVLKMRKGEVVNSLSMSTPRCVSINRANITTEVLQLYRTDPNIVHHFLQVTFIGEEAAEDLEGVTREMFTVFMRDFSRQHLEGHRQKRPAMDHRVLDSDTFQIFGRIVSHAYILVGYPPILAAASMAWLTCGRVTGDVLVASLKQYLSEDDANTLQYSLDHPEELANKDGPLYAKCCRIVFALDARELPGPSNIHKMLESLASSSLIYKVMWPLMQIRQGLFCYPLLWGGCGASVLQALTEDMVPTGEKVLRQLQFEHSSSGDLYSLEERVKGYLEEFLLQLSRAELAKLLQFWTASDLLLADKLTVAFNSTEGLQQRPIANTCVCQLVLSRLYLSQAQFTENVMRHLSSGFAEQFDSA